jgi:ABC-2 type transport system ATP-binding protein
MQTAVFLELKSVKKTFGAVTALSLIDAEISEGRIFGIVGPDGAGKSTVLRLAVGLIRPDRGTVSLLGNTDPRAVRSSVGYLPQRFGLYPNLTVMENIRLYGALYGKVREKANSLAHALLSRTDLWEFRDRFAGELSGGMKQKLALAACLVHSPKALLLDEPTTGVDPLSRREFWALLYEVNAEGVTIVVSTPYMDEAELCTDLILLDRGAIIKRGTPEELLEAYGRSILEVRVSGSENSPRVKGDEVRKVLLGVPGVLAVNIFGACYHVETEGGDAAELAVRRALGSMPNAAEGDGITVEKIPPSLEDLFISVEEGEERK